MSLEAYVNQDQDKYISVLDFVNDLYKQARPQAALKMILSYLFERYQRSIDSLNLYEKKEFGYPSPFYLVDLLRLETPISILQDIYKCLDSTQIGLNFSDECLKPYKNFYFKLSEASKLYGCLRSNDVESDITNELSSKMFGQIKSNAPPPPNHIKTAPSFKQRTIGDVIKAEKQKEPILPNGFQQMTMLYDYFTPHQAACFIAGLHPDFNGCDDGLEMGNSVIEGGIKSGKLVADDDGQIKADDLKPFLYSKHWIMEGFNDDLPNDTGVLNQATTDYEKRIADLEQQLADKEANASFMVGSPSVEKGEPKTNEQIISDLRDQVTQLTNDNEKLKKQARQQADAPADDKELSGLDKYNSDKAYIIATSQALASYIWSMDTEKAIRTGDMVQQVRHVMHSVAPKLLPDNDAIRQWLSSIAPDYAKKGGKTPKDAPSEISLIMKK